MPAEPKAAPRQSCGIVLVAAPGRVFLAHATGTSHWDIPKGLRDPLEAAQATALRELREETGLLLAAADLRDLGAFAYRKDKGLHLFGAQVAQAAIDPARCVCRSFFTHPKSGRDLPEVDRFAWVPFEEVPQRCTANLTRVLLQEVGLPAGLVQWPKASIAFF